MARIAIGELPAVTGERFPRLYLEIDGRLYLFRGVDDSRFGKALADAARETVSTGVDRAPKAGHIIEIEVDPI